MHAKARARLPSGARRSGRGADDEQTTGPARVRRPRIPWEHWFPALGEANVRLYVFGQAVSIMGTWVMDVMLNLVLWETTRSPGLLGLLNFVLYVPGLVITPLFSALLSAANARRRTLGVLVAGLGVALALTALAALGQLVTPVILGLAVARGVLNGMEQPARQMLLASSVARAEHIGGAVALNTLVFQVARMTGPGLAALLYASVGAPWGFGFAAAALSVMIGCVVAVRPAAQEAVAAPDAGSGGLRGAIDFVRGDRYGSLFVPVVVCMAGFTGGYHTLVPVLADRVFGDTARWTSVFFAATGAGALIAALLMSTRLADRLQRRLPVPLPWCVAAALLGLGASRDAQASLLCFGVIGFGMSALSVGTTSVLHRRVPPQARNGLIALMLVAFNGMVALSQVMAGLLAERLGVQPSFWVMGGCMLGGLLWLFAPRWRRCGRLELDAGRI